MTTTAVILAAGMGTRLKELGREAPKGFLKLGRKPIIEESLDKLKAAGIGSVVLVTGHLSEMYDALAERSAGFVETVRNDLYAESGSGYSLYVARTSLEPGEGFLLLESDLIYEARALRVALDEAAPDVILLSGRTDSGDEVYVETKNGCLVAMAKDRSKLGAEIGGELVGISKISGRLYREFCVNAERLFARSLKVEYEAGLTETAKTYPIPCRLIDDLAWAEIDDENHLARAREKIYPRL